MRFLKDALTGITVLIIITAIITLIAMAAPSVIDIYPRGGETVNGTVRVSANASDDVGFIVKVSFNYSDDGGSNWYPIGDNTTSDPYTVQWNTIGLTDGSNYLIRATATNDTGFTASNTSDATFTVQNTMSSPTAPNVTNVVVTPGVTSATVSFDVNQSNAPTRIKYGTTSLDKWSDWDNSTPYSIDLTGLTNGTTYYYSIYAYNASDTTCSTNTTIDTFTTITPTAPNVTNVVVTPGVTSATVSFDVNQSNAPTRIKYGTTSLDKWSDWDNSTPYSIDLTGLTNGTTYYYSIYAYNASDTTCSTNTTIDTFTTITPTAPNVTNVVVTPGVTSATVSFDVNQSNAPTRIKYGTTSLDKWSDWDNSTPYSIDLTGLTNGTTYYYSIYAYNASDTTCSTNTTIDTFTTGQPPPNITTPTSNPQNTESVEGVQTTFYIEVDQIVNISWKLDGNYKYTNTSVKNATFITTASAGTHTVTANASNNNGYVNQTWNVDRAPQILQYWLSYLGC
ncbi:hypothetical protein FHEFKHOI_01804 [Candidatus Methanoperedenaceae archaeon GB50]|nr:hypothetical protein FHEFKHOI_01804 [Candidatus Methanoperedenaceae archaeon GB50]